MGIYEESPADALFTRVRKRVLGILFLESDRSFLVTELIARAGVGTGAVHRELGRLTNSGIVTMTPVGRQRRYQANAQSPIFDELRDLITKAVGLVDPLGRALATLDDRIQAAFVYGFDAEESGSEISLVVIADDVPSTQLSAALGEAEEVIGRPINAVLFTPADWPGRPGGDAGFAKRVVSLPKIFIIGTERSLS